MSASSRKSIFHLPIFYTNWDECASAILAEGERGRRLTLMNADFSAFPARTCPKLVTLPILLLPGGIKGGIISGREKLSGSLSPPGRPAYIYCKSRLSARDRRAAFTFYLAGGRRSIECRMSNEE
jgi:hypothetical protein